jgi:PilZ domain
MSADGGPREGRQYPRVAVDAFVKILKKAPSADSGPVSDREYVFRTRDLSVGGLFLYTRVGHMYPFYVGAALVIELYDFDQAVEFKAMIVRIVQPGSPESERFPSGFGVKIVEIDDANRARLVSLIERAQKGDPIY